MGPGVATLLHSCLESLYYYSCMENVDSSMVNCMEAYKSTNYDSGTFSSWFFNTVYSPGSQTSHFK